MTKDQAKFDEAVREMGRIRNDIIPNGSRWKHKNGTVYTAHHIVLIEATLAPAVFYSGDGMFHFGWVRPVEEFLDGRFEMIEGAKAYPSEYLINPASLEYTIDPTGKTIWFDSDDGLFHVASDGPMHVKEVVK